MDVGCQVHPTATFLQGCELSKWTQSTWGEGTSAQVTEGLPHWFNQRRVPETYSEISPSMSGNLEKPEASERVGIDEEGRGKNRWKHCTPGVELRGDLSCGKDDEK